MAIQQDINQVVGKNLDAKGNKTLVDTTLSSLTANLLKGKTNNQQTNQSPANQGQKSS